jgi:WD40 repeat protein
MNISLQVTGVAFQQGGGAAGSGGSGAGGGQTLFSGSLDRTLKLWDVKDMGFLDTLYGHQSEVWCQRKWNGSSHFSLGWFQLIRLSLVVSAPSS